MDVSDPTTVVAQGVTKEPGAAALVYLVMLCFVWQCVMRLLSCTCQITAQRKSSWGALPLVVGAARPKDTNNSELGVTSLVVDGSHVAHDWEARLCLLGPGECSSVGVGDLFPAQFCQIKSHLIHTRIAISFLVFLQVCFLRVPPSRGVCTQRAPMPRRPTLRPLLWAVMLPPTERRGCAFSASALWTSAL